MANVIHTIKGNQYLYEHHRKGDKVISTYKHPLGVGGKKRKAKHGGGAPVKSSAVDGKNINTSEGNHSIGQKPKETKNNMSELDKMNQSVIDAEKDAENTRLARLNFIENYEKQDGVEMSKTAEYKKWDRDLAESRAVRSDLQQQQGVMKRDLAKKADLETPPNKKDFSYQYGNTLPEIKTRADYEKITNEYGVSPDSDNEIRKSYGLKFAEFTTPEWDKKTRDNRVKHVIDAKYQQSIEKRDADKRRADPETKKASDRHAEAVRKENQKMYELDNDIY